MIQKIEAKMGKSLTTAQSNQLRDAFSASAKDMVAAQDEFIKSIAKTFGMKESDVRPFIPQIGRDNSDFDKNMMPKIERKIGRAITRDERQRVIEADNRKKGKIRPIQERLAKSISGITGLSLSEVKSLLPRVGL